MATTIQVHEMTGAGAGVDKTGGTVRFKKADNTIVDSNDPIPIPGAGEELSFTKNLQVYLVSTTDTSLTNLVGFSDGNNGWTGVDVHVQAVAAFTANVESDAGGVSMFTYTSGAPLDCDALNPGPWDAADNASYIGDVVIAQMRVSSTASNGLLAPAEPWSFQIDVV